MSQQNDYCCVCNTPLPNGTLMVNPFAQEQFKADRYPRRYAHACQSCIDKCYSGEITEQHWNAIVGKGMGLLT